MHVPKEVQERVNAELRRCIKVASEHFNRSFDFPNIEYNVRGTAAGYAKSDTYTVSFNPVLLMENVDEFIKRTVIHEFAHLVDAIVYPETRQCGFVYTKTGRVRRTKRSLHGPTWKEIMSLLGGPTSRCHTYDVSNARVKQKAQHIYRCNGCSKEMSLGPKRHRSMQTGQTVYWLRGCKHHGGFTYVGLKGGNQNIGTTRKVPTPKMPTSGSKIERVIKLLYTEPNLSRDEAINRIRTLCDMSSAGAQTYYYKAKQLLKAIP